MQNRWALKRRRNEKKKKEGRNEREKKKMKERSRERRKEKKKTPAVISTHSLNRAARLKKKELFVSRVWRSAVKVNPSPLLSDGRRWPSSSRGFIGTLPKFHYFSAGLLYKTPSPESFFIYRRETLMHATQRNTHTHACLSPAGVQKKRMQIKQSVFFLHHSKWKTIELLLLLLLLLLFYFFFTCWTDSLRIKKGVFFFFFFFYFHRIVESLPAENARNHLSCRGVHVSFSRWIDRLIVPGNVLPPFLFNTWLISSNQRRH